MSPDHPLVSVIIPTYNRDATIGATLDSALAQTYPALEIVVVDDGSTDDTQQILAPLLHDIVNIRQENRGVAAARNEGISRSRGSIVMFLDSDDLWLPKSVETQVAVLEAAGDAVPCSMCDLTMNRRDGDDETMFAERRLRPRHTEGLWTNVQDVLATRFLFTNQTLAIRRSALESAGLFDESLWVMEDFELAMRLSIIGPWAYTTRTLAVWQEGSSNSLTERAGRDQKRLNATLLTICRKLQAEGIPQSRLARYAIAYMARKSVRGLQFAEAASPPPRALLEAQAFIEERILERAYRNSWMYPRIESIAL